MSVSPIFCTTPTPQPSSAALSSSFLIPTFGFAAAQHLRTCTDLRPPSLRRALLVACLLHCARHLSGLHTLLYHLVDVVRLPGQLEPAAFLNLLVTFAVVNVTTIFVLLKVDG